MFETTTKHGKKITSTCYDWCLMDAIISDISEDKGINEKEAETYFYKELRDYDDERYDKLVCGETIEDALDGNTELLEFREEFLDNWGYECIEVEDIEVEETSIDPKDVRELTEEEVEELEAELPF